MHRRLSQFSSFLSTSDKAVWVILYIGLVHGLIYVFFIPAWQHYDEMSHFEYAWMLANHPMPVTEANVSQEMRLDVVVSMEANRFFEYINAPAGWMGIPQFVDPPFYHLLASIAVRLFPSSSVTNQMYVMRLISLVFLVISIAAAWASARELTRPGSPLRWMTPLFLALLPAFVDLMTAVNNDSAAIAFCSLFFWISVRMVKRGFRWPDFLALLLVTALGVLTKKTAWVILPFVPVALALSVLPLSKRWIVWAGGAALAAAGVLALFDWGDARYWYRQSEQPGRTRVESAEIISFPYALRIEAAPGQQPSLLQNLPSEAVHAMRGKTVTVGGWVWASRPATVLSPGLIYHGSATLPDASFSLPVEVGPVPRFVSMEILIPTEISRAIIALIPLQGVEAQPLAVNYAGVFLVEGTCHMGEIPMFGGPDGAEGTWCGKSFQNFARNGSAAAAWFAPREPVFKALNRYLPLKRSDVMEVPSFLFDGEGFGWYYRMTTSRLFTSFWAVFGWGNVLLRSSAVYRLLEVVTLLAGAGAVLRLVLQRRFRPPFLLYILAFGLAGWLTAYIAGIYFSGLIERVVIPVARYAYPVIVPTALALNLGWWEWARRVGEKAPALHPAGFYVYFLLLLILDVYALFSIADFYY